MEPHSLKQPNRASAIPFVSFAAHDGETLDGDIVLGFRVGHDLPKESGSDALSAKFRGDLEADHGFFALFSRCVETRAGTRFDGKVRFVVCVAPTDGHSVRERPVFKKIEVIDGKQRCEWFDGNIPVLPWPTSRRTNGASAPLDVAAGCTIGYSVLKTL